MLTSIITTPEQTAMLIHQGQIQFSAVIRIHQATEEAAIHLLKADQVLPTATREAIQFHREAQAADHIHPDLLIPEAGLHTAADHPDQFQVAVIHRVHLLVPPVQAHQAHHPAAVAAEGIKRR